MKKYYSVFLLSIMFVTSSYAEEALDLQANVAESVPLEVLQTVPTESKLNYLDLLKSSSEGLIAQAIAPLYAGYGYTLEEQEKARQKIVTLEKEIERYKAEILNTEEYYPERDTDHLKEQLKEAENELHKQKIVTGQAWSTTRKFVVGTAALATVALLGFAVFKSLYHAPAAVDPNNVTALDKRLAAIRKQRTLVIAGQEFINPAYRETDELQAQKMLNNAIERKKEFIEDTIPYRSPDLVSLDDERKLDYRLREIQKQKEVYVDGKLYKNRNYNKEDERVAKDQYYDAASRSYKKIAIDTPYVSPPPVDPSDPDYVAKLGQRAKAIENQQKVMVNWEQWKNAHFDEKAEQELAQARKEYEVAVDKKLEELAENTPYKSPDWVVEPEKEVNVENYNALETRLWNIRRQKNVNFANRTAKNLNYNQADEDFAQEQLQQAVHKIWEKEGKNIPYVSPPLVVDSDENGEVNIQAKDLDALKSRLQAIERQAFLKYNGDGYMNPNFNTEDYRVAKEQYEHAVKLALEEYIPTVQFEVPEPIKPYNGVSFKSKELWKFKSRLRDIKKQKFFTFEGQKYSNPTFNKEEYLKALEEYVDHVEFFMKALSNSGKGDINGKEKALENAFPWDVKDREEYISGLKKEIEDLNKELHPEKNQQEQKAVANQHDQGGWLSELKKFFFRFGASGGG